MWGNIIGALAGGGAQSTPGGGGDHLNMDGSVSGGSGSTNSGNPKAVGTLMNMSDNKTMQQIGTAMGGIKMAFYGGETCDQIRSACPVKIVESSKPIQSKDEKSFYTNVHIPRKKV